MQVLIFPQIKLYCACMFLFFLNIILYNRIVQTTDNKLAAGSQIYTKKANMFLSTQYAYNYTG